jgi:two-component system, NtrC family, sensor kinase
MSDIATGILHNVGNVLNSLNISQERTLNFVSSIKSDKFTNIINQLLSFEGNFEEYLRKNDIGKLMLPYLKELSIHLENKKKDMQGELGTLKSHI